MKFNALILGLMMLPQIALGAGIVSFSEDVLPLLKQYPQIADPFLREFEVSNRGTAIRINGKICPGLAGARVSPYKFRAKERGMDSGELILTVNSDIEFFDRENRVVFRIRDGVADADDSELERAEHYRERFSSLVLTAIERSDN